MTAPRVLLAPDPETWAVDAVSKGGGRPVRAGEPADALLWTAQGAWDELPATLRGAPDLRWVQLPSAGIEGVAELGVFGGDRVWTCAKGVYSEPVAEHALALALAGLRGLPARARAHSWGEQDAQTLYDAPVVVLGAGGITQALLGLLAPFRAQVTVVRRDASHEVPGARRTVGLDELDDVLPGARVVVLALALTARTERVIGAAQLALLDERSWLVNVARGRHVDTAALVAALQSGALGGAALDVTDPEPLPDDSPLWSMDNVLVTPHTANPVTTSRPLLATRVTDNVRRFADGRDLLGLVDIAAGY